MDLIFTNSTKQKHHKKEGPVYAKTIYPCSLLFDRLCVSSTVSQSLKVAPESTSRKYFNLKATISRDIFRTLPNIYDGAFHKNS